MAIDAAGALAPGDPPKHPAGGLVGSQLLQRIIAEGTCSVNDAGITLAGCFELCKSDLNFYQQFFSDCD